MKSLLIWAFTGFIGISIGNIAGVSSSNKTFTEIQLKRAQGKIPDFEKIECDRIIQRELYKSQKP